MRRKTCLTCYGTGRITVYCKVCAGMAYVGINYENIQPCRACKGKGYTKKCDCDNCNGKGFRDWVDDIRRPINGKLHKRREKRSNRERS